MKEDIILEKKYVFQRTVINYFLSHLQSLINCMPIHGGVRPFEICILVTIKL